MNIFNLENKVALVTGAIGLLGKQHCIALAEAGTHVIVCDLDLEECNKFASTLPTRSIGVSANITNEVEIKALSLNIIKEFKKIDILVNNAAINDMVEQPIQPKNQKKLNFSQFENYPVDLFRKVLDVNVTGMFICSKIIGSEMAKNQSGNIINIASTYGLVAPNQDIYKKEDGTQEFFKSPCYPAAKGAVLSFTRFLAIYWGKEGIRANSISPGGIENNQDEQFILNYSKLTPMGRMAKKDEFKGALLFLASDASSYITGANIVVDGGWTVW